jgi:osmotically inducible lipoprotein OsmB
VKAVLSAALRDVKARRGGSLSLGLVGCGDDPGTRAVTGGLIGAGVGAGAAAVTGGRPATGALIGGGIGAVGGALTTP